MKKIILMIAIILSSFTSVSAFVNSPNCAIGNCQLTVSDCGSGLIDLYSSATCTGNPLYEFTFNNGATVWYPQNPATYYAYALCDDGKTHSACTPVNVASSSAQTTSTTSSGGGSSGCTSNSDCGTNQICQSGQCITSSGGGGGGGNSNTVFYALIVVIIAVVAFIIYRLLSKKKKPKINYATLYRKWGR